MMLRACFHAAVLCVPVVGLPLAGCSSAGGDSAKDSREVAARGASADAAAVIVGLRNESDVTLRVRFWLAPPPTEGARVPAWAFEETKQAAVNPGSVIGYRVKKPREADGSAAPDPVVRVQIDPVPALATGSLWFELEAPGPYVVVAAGTSGAKLTLTRSDGRALKPLTAEGAVGPEPKP